jgi:N-acetylglucosaminyldiphosphoundecaprenol N-acetyl-beta-D-mannosaminyltransferase
VNKVNILSVLIDNFSMPELLEKLRFGGVVFTPNVDHLIKLQKDRDFHRVYNAADYRVCDSQLVIYAAKFLGQPIQEKISGSDLFPAFYQHYKDDKNVKIFLLGGPSGVAEVARQNINNKVGREIVVDCYSPPFGFEKNEAECKKVVNLIERSGATVLAVGLGAPKQEKWIYEYKNRLPNIQLFFAIGATIEFEAGYRPRAPKWISEAGLEWLYRLLSEPRRLWKRYLVDDLPFFLLILQQKFNLYSHKAYKLKMTRGSKVM